MTAKRLPHRKWTYKMVRIVDPNDPGEMYHAVPAAFFSESNPRGRPGSIPRLRVVVPPPPGASVSRVRAFERARESEIPWTDFWGWCSRLGLEVREVEGEAFRVGYTEQQKAKVRKMKRDGRLAYR